MLAHPLKSPSTLLHLPFEGFVWDIRVGIASGALAVLDQPVAVGSLPGLARRIELLRRAAREKYDCEKWAHTR
jgi:hypothetical protein